MHKASTKTIFVGLDVHKDNIVACWVSADGEDEKDRRFPNDPKEIGRFFKRLKEEADLRVCYEAGPCGYEVRRQLGKMEIPCDVIAPALIPRKPGERIKTDKRDARKLARLYRAGELTAIHVPTEAEEFVRDLVRCREDTVEDVQRQRQRLLKFLVRHGRVWRETSNWSQRHWAWLRAQRFENASAQRTMEEYLAQLDFTCDRLTKLETEIERVADERPWREIVSRLRCLRGIGTLTALALVVEVQDFRRFENPRDLMGFVGLVPSIYASGKSEVRGSITKSGNGHIRRLLVEAAWHYRHKPAMKGHLRKRCAGQPEPVVKEAMHAQERLNLRYRRLTGRGKPAAKAAVAVARELVGFIWAMAVKHAPAVA